MSLLTFQKLGENRNAPRIWIESRRLTALGFGPDTPIALQPRHNGIVIQPCLNATRHVSQRSAAMSVRPIIDINNRSDLAGLDGFDEIKVSASVKRIDVTPSTRAFYIRKRKDMEPPYKVGDFFAGGGLLSSATTGLPDFKVMFGVEMEPRYADVWQASHAEAIICQSDLRMIHPAEIPPFDIGLFGIPCTSHSNIGRAKKNLPGIPELGDTGDLFLAVANIIAHRLPLACVFENVPNFATSLAGLTLKAYLGRIGYHVTETVLNPHAEWNEPQDRKRWVMVATLCPGFTIEIPKASFVGTLASYLDAPGPQDKEDCERIANTIAGLRLHNARHKAQGHGFEFTTVNHQSVRCPTLVRSYHKINTGPFVETYHGLRMLRKHEFEKLMGAESVASEHYATAVEVLGQGVQPRVFQQILQQLSDFMKLSRLIAEVSHSARRKDSEHE